jgi:probable H4MPT-linked C1 transfer pathway protein
LIDTGSTTTDIIPLEDGRPVAQGLTDTDRLVSSELVYTGVLRTPLAALGPTITWRGRQVGLMAEFFSTLGDVHLLLGDLEEDPQRIDTADGRPMTRAAAAARIVRMIGADLDMLTMDDAGELALLFANLQTQQIVAAIGRVVEERRPARVVLAGSGDFLAARAAAAALPEVPTIRLAERLGPAASAAACAYALLHLAEPEK